MCILVSEDTHKKKYLDRANRAGLKDDQLKPMADLLWDMKVSKKIGEAKAKLVWIDANIDQMTMFLNAFCMFIGWPLWNTWQWR